MKQPNELHFDQDIILENKRVKLEPLQLNHYDVLLPISNRYPDLLKLSPPKFGTPELLKQYIESNLAERKNHTKYPFAIFDKEVEEYAGSTAFLNISPENKRLEIGSTWIGKHFQRTGLNRNCKFLLMQYVFEVLEYERIELKTDKRNLQSQKGMEGIGAKFEGTLRSHTVMSDGYRRNTVYYSILKNEWEGIKETIFSEISRQ
ncbi:Protein N-acetyltransferase, RimJ/RimL family [Flavobacteriaceae bacterium MAR_2010_188]|nr:Protein N-acetyltransferase, RimJ/RimL family [Flavobacteriaceae bacterium MAR_2010_188]